jgi:hypothetical protein
MFNREHVLPQSFGTFPDNPVLRDLVCNACNNYFSRDLELRLGRDSAEGLERFRNGLASPKKRASIGPHIDVRYRGGRLDGAILEWQMGADGRMLQVHPVPQIGVSASPDGPFEWHRVGELPSGDALRERGFKIESTYFLSGGLSKEEVVRHVQGLGHKLVEQPAECDAGVDADGMVPLMISGTIDPIIMRAVAKIAFNYFAFHYPSIASMDQFNSIRRYIRYGEHPPANPVSLFQASILGGVPEDRQLLAHVVTVAWDGSTERVVAQISLFSWVQYRVVLTADAFAIAPLCIDSGHLFDPLNRQVRPLSRWISPANAAPVPMTKKPTRK